ncbi:unnamed protein product, partial [Mesorhabditis spiculigera]
MAPKTGPDTIDIPDVDFPPPMRDFPRPQQVSFKMDEMMPLTPSQEKEIEQCLQLGIPRSEAIRIFHKVRGQRIAPREGEIAGDIAEKWFSGDQQVQETQTPRTPGVDSCANKEDAELQLAIEASREQSIIDPSDKEKIDLNKAIESSLQDSDLSRSRYEASLPDDPHELIRKEPMTGLYNIGNTCWFNSLVHLLFQLPALRRLLYVSSPPEPPGPLSREETASRRILLSLRRLFAQMEATQRSYIDPTEAVEAVAYAKKQVEGHCIIGQQQDAVELLLQVVQWLDQAMARHHRPHHGPDQLPEIVDAPLTPPPIPPTIMELPVSATPSECEMDTSAPGQAATSCPDLIDFARPELPRRERLRTVSSGQLPQPESPFEPLFYGQTVSHKASEDIASSSRTPATLQVWNLAVCYEDLHDALEAAHLPSDGAQLWCDKLPAVLFFNPNRFQYKDGRLSKLHNEFLFPDTIYMDRYYLRNRLRVLALHEERMRQREQLADIRAQLKGFDEFPLGKSNNHQAELADVLRGMREFINPSEEQPTSSSSASFSVRQDDSEAMETSTCDLSTKGLNDDTSPVILGPCLGPLNRESPYEKEVSSKASFVPDRPKRVPKARLTEELRSQMAIQLEELLAQTLTEKDELTAAAGRLEAEIAGTYDMDPELHREGYSLHYVIIHQGEATAGHYWAYVRDRTTENGWVKLNDRRIERTTREAMIDDAIGGKSRTSSAYCFVYVRDDAHWLFQQGDAGLPAELRPDVDKQNEELERMIVDFERKKEVAQKAGNIVWPLLSDPHHLATDLCLDVEIPHSDKQLTRIINQAREMDRLVEAYCPRELEQLCQDRYAAFYQELIRGVVGEAFQQLPISSGADVQSVYHKLITDWPALVERVRPKEVPFDPRHNPFDWQQSLGKKIPAKVAQLAITLCLEYAADNTALRAFANQKLIAFRTVEGAIEVEQQTWRLWEKSVIHLFFWNALHHSIQFIHRPFYETGPQFHLGMDPLLAAHQVGYSIGRTLEIFQYLLQFIDGDFNNPLDEMWAKIIPHWQLISISCIAILNLSTRLLERLRALPRADNVHDAVFLYLLICLSKWAKGGDPTARLVKGEIELHWVYMEQVLHGLDVDGDTIIYTSTVMALLNERTTVPDRLPHSEVLVVDLSHPDMRSHIDVINHTIHQIGFNDEKHCRDAVADHLRFCTELMARLVQNDVAT